MFLGEYEHTIDQKGRLAIPIKFRNALAEGAVVTRGLDQCLTLYPKKEWEALAAKIAALPINNPAARSFARFMLAGAMTVEGDKQGRIVLPGYLRQEGELNLAVTIVGLANRLEIWDRAKWRGYSETARKNSSEVASQLAEVNLN